MTFVRNETVVEVGGGGGRNDDKTEKFGYKQADNAINLLFADVDRENKIN